MRFLVKKAPDNFIKTVNDEISSNLNRHFDNFYPEFGYEEDLEKLSMPVEITEKENEYDIRAELPGVKKEDWEIDNDKNYLTIRERKEEEACEDKKAYKKSEFKYGEFTRSVYLPQDIDMDKIDATLEHGVLKIKVPKLEVSKDTVKKITVK